MLATLSLLACGPIATGGPGCRETLVGQKLPAEINESSGVAVSLDHPGVFWTHNDAGSVLFAVDEKGTLLGQTSIRPRARDWEDLALAMCPGGGSCLYVSDLGDNYEERESIRLMRLPEPDPAALPDSIQADVFPVRLPDGPRDIEALLVLPGERIMVVTKGRNDPITVYRYPGSLRPDTVTLEEVQRLSDGPRILPRQVTGGAVSPSGKVVAVRTYESLQFYNVQADTLVPVDGGLVNLRTLREGQGEGVAIGLNGQVVLTSEAGPIASAGSMSMMRCRLQGL